MPTATETSERVDAAAERLKAEQDRNTATVNPKRSKSPRYYVLLLDDGAYALLTREPISAPSRKAAITKAVEEHGEPGVAVMGSETFVVVAADAWVEITRTLRPPPVAYVEEWA